MSQFAKLPGLPERVSSLSVKLGPHKPQNWFEGCFLRGLCVGFCRRGSPDLANPWWTYHEVRFVPKCETLGMGSVVPSLGPVLS
jgi:hypothetical protein